MTGWMNLVLCLVYMEVHIHIVNKFTESSNLCLLVLNYSEHCHLGDVHNFPMSSKHLSIYVTEDSQCSTWPTCETWCNILFFIPYFSMQTVNYNFPKGIYLFIFIYFNCLLGEVTFGGVRKDATFAALFCF